MRSLWKRQATVNSNNTEETYDSLLKKYASRPTPKKLWELSSNAVVVSQQVALTCYFLARHSITFNGKDDETLVQYSTFIIVSSLFIIMAYSLSADQSTQQPRKDKARQRFLDAILLAILLRLIASLLRTLTASYSSDTVQVLVAALMLLHLIACDYSYANGVTPITRVVSKMPSHRPIFRGGTISLNAALFATTLLISRLQSNILAYFYVALAIVVFAFYPSTRYSICNKYPAKSSAAMWVVTLAIFISTLLILDSVQYRLAFTLAMVTIILIIPLWKQVLQQRKVLLHGPWDIPKATNMQLDFVAMD